MNYTDTKLPAKHTKAYKIVILRLKNFTHTQIAKKLNITNRHSRSTWYNWNNKEQYNKCQRRWHSENPGLRYEYQKKYRDNTPERKDYHAYYMRCRRAKIKPMGIRKWATDFRKWEQSFG